MNLLDLMVKIGVDDQASDKVAGIGAKITSGLGNAVKTVGKVVATGTAAAGAGAVALTKAAVDSYASYEQLVGGVDKLYQGASGKLQQYAQNAYKTSGMSANDYMEQATSFSAALINSLGGDVDKAADQTDKAMRLMSDNVNTFGTDAEAVQNAIQGLSRENYTMLDNLKLGYAGTKEGMENLIADAEKYAQTVKGMGFDEYAEQMKDTGLSAEELKQRYDELTSSTDLTMGNFSDMIDAIDIIQEKQHIMGTTAKEAMTTIEGSVTAAKASWENLLTAIGAGDETMIRDSVNGLVDSIFGTFSEETGKREGGVINNLLPVVQNVGKALVSAIPGIAESMVWNLIEVINDTFGTDFDAEEIMTTVENAFGKVTTAVTNFVSALTGSTDLSGFQTMFDTVMTVAGQVFTFLTEHATEIGTVIGTVITVVGQVAEVATNLFNIISPYLPFIATLIGTFGVLMPIINGVVGVVGAISGAVTFLTTVVLPAIGMIQSVGGAVTALVTILGGPITVIAAIAAAIIAFVATNEDARNAVLNAIQAVVDFFMGLPDTLAAIWTAIKDNIHDTWERMKETVQKGMFAIKEGVETAWENIVGWVSGIPDRIVNALGNLGNLLWDAGTSVINGLWDGMSKKADELFGWVGGIADTIANLKGPLPYDEKVLVDNGNALMDGLSSGITGRFDSEIAPYLTSMAGDIANNIGDLGGLLYGAGNALMDGLFDGMMQAASGMLSWVAGLANQIAYLKGPLPYDRKVLIENGMALMSGLRRGLGEGFEREVMPYVSTLAGQMQDSIEAQPLMSPSLSYEYTAVPAKQQQGPATVRDDAVVSLLTAILSTMPQGVYLDKRTLVGQLAPDMNVALGGL